MIANMAAMKRRVPLTLAGARNRGREGMFSRTAGQFQPTHTDLTKGALRPLAASLLPSRNHLARPGGNAVRELCELRSQLLPGGRRRPRLPDTKESGAGDDISALSAHRSRILDLDRYSGVGVQSSPLPGCPAVTALSYTPAAIRRRAPQSARRSAGNLVGMN